MRNRSALVLVAAMVSVLALAFAPTQAASAYQMEGGGSATFSPGIPFNPADNTTVSLMSFGSFPIMGSGVLQGQNVAGAYTCNARTGSSLSVLQHTQNPTRQSQVVGGAMSYKLTFVWTCTKNAGQNVAGPSTIAGYFSNDPALNSANQPGRPVFRGVFDSTAPINADGGGDSVAMTCLGGFGPFNPQNPGAALSDLQNGKVTNASFLGECTAASTT